MDPLLVDGTAVLSTAAHVGWGSDRVVGAAAVGARGRRAGRVCRGPLRQPDGAVHIGDTEVDGQELVAATLAQVAAEAARLAGGPVGEVRLVVPAGWGPRRRTWLRQAAYRAGWGQPRLTEAPVQLFDQKPQFRALPFIATTLPQPHCTISWLDALSIQNRSYDW